MLLERKLVEILDNHTMRRGEISRSDFINFVTNERLWPRKNYPLLGDEMFRRKIENKIDDCIKREFMKEDNGTIKVDKQGRDFIKILGFLEEFLKRRKRTVVIPGSVILGALAAILANYFIDK